MVISQHSFKVFHAHVSDVTNYVLMLIILDVSLQVMQGIY